MRQFVAGQWGAGYSTQMQKTGEEKIGGIQFEIHTVSPETVERLRAEKEIARRAAGEEEESDEDEGEEEEEEEHDRSFSKHQEHGPSCRGGRGGYHGVFRGNINRGRGGYSGQRGRRGVGSMSRGSYIGNTTMPATPMYTSSPP